LARDGAVGHHAFRQKRLNLTDLGVRQDSLAGSKRSTSRAGVGHVLTLIAIL